MYHEVIIHAHCVKMIIYLRVQIKKNYQANFTMHENQIEKKNITHCPFSLSEDKWIRCATIDVTLVERESVLVYGRAKLCSHSTRRALIGFAAMQASR